MSKEVTFMGEAGAEASTCTLLRSHEEILKPKRAMGDLSHRTTETEHIPDSAGKRKWASRNFGCNIYGLKPISDNRRVQSSTCERSSR
jgi:hypothetical protein